MDAPSQITMAPAPFSPDDPGDCMLQTSDNVQFKTYRLFLSVGSSIFNDMFGMPQPPTQHTQDVPVINIPEDATTLAGILAILSPSGIPLKWNVDSALNLILACQKYFIAKERVHAFVDPVFKDPDLLETDPVGLYALAWRFGTPRDVSRASRYSHRVWSDDTATAKRVVRLSGNLDALAAMHRFRTEREAALNNIIDATRIRDDICSKHGRDITLKEIADDTDLNDRMNDQLDVIKLAARGALSLSYPEYDTILEFFNITEGFPPNGDPDPDEWGVEGCLCFTALDAGAASMIMKRLIAAYPQEIVPEPGEMGADPDFP